MPGLCGMLISRKAAARSPTQARSFGRIFDRRLSASQPSWVNGYRSVLPDLQQTAFSEVAKIATRRTLHQIDGELQKANFPSVVYALNDRAERFVLVFDVSPCAVNHRVD